MEPTDGKQGDSNPGGGEMTIGTGEVAPGSNLAGEGGGATGM